MGLVFLSGGTALANYGPHGGYGTWTDNGDGTMTADEVNPDSDACAGCHRAHTAVSSVTWTDTGNGVKNALLIGGTATTIKEFCYTCHSDAGVGAGTNVQAGVYEAAHVAGATTPGYITAQSEAGATLNGGGFDAMPSGGSISSTHEISGLAGGVAWGERKNLNDGGTNITMDCASCHDPHGSSNYRILKDKVNGVDVGGYIGGLDSGIDPVPNPSVISNEVGFPTPTNGSPAGGFGLHRNYAIAAQNPTGVAYAPDYTEARYAEPVGQVAGKGMSSWCAACHTMYNTTSSSGQTATYNVSDGYFDAVRHRHPVNVPLTTFKGPRSLLVGSTAVSGNTGALNDPWNLNATPSKPALDIPLEHDTVTEGRGNAQANNLSDYIGCLTCHRAHGTNVTMSGYANSKFTTKPAPDSGGTTATTQGVQPTMDSTLLRANNRGVCERCHNK